MVSTREFVKQNFTSESPNLGTVVPIVTAALGAGTALLTAVGVGTGLAVRLLRNDPCWVTLFVLVLLGSISLAAFAARRRWLVLAGAAFFLALGGFTWLAGDVSGAAERPGLVATAETTSAGMVKITATVKADGLRTRELIYLMARGHTRLAIDPTTGEMSTEQAVARAADAKLPQTKQGAATPAVIIKEAAFGPDASGSINATFYFEMSPAVFKDIVITAARDNQRVSDLLGSEDPAEPECLPKPGETEDKLNRACVRFVLPFGAIRPLLNVSLGMPNDKGVRQLTTAVGAVNVSPPRVIVLKAWVGKALRMQQTFAPDLGGKVQVTPSTTLSAIDADICVVAALVTPGSGEDVERGYCDKPSASPVTVAFARL
jgi:hypothetical protein